VRFLTPTENKRLNELIGFLCIAVAVLIGLALISYSPRDAAFNVSATGEEDHVTRNWMGPVGAYSADLLFQIFGFAAFLIPVAMGILGYRWCRSRAIDSQAATLSGYVLLMLSLPSLLSMLRFMPDVRGAVPAGGVLGTLLSHGLQSGFNFGGALLVAGSLLIVSLFMTTRFSFSGAHAWASSNKGPLGKIEKMGILQRAQARWHDWREEREQERMRRAVEERRIVGRKPVAPQIAGKGQSEKEQPKGIKLEDLSDIFKRKKSAGVAEKEAEEEDDVNHKAPIMVLK
jgi:S-DNA-T family DNA segregation ATPase FtsK/SpoIIIE